eukprot:4035277-Pleurochrysis_carterae.AAC.3
MRISLGRQQPAEAWTNRATAVSRAAQDWRIPAYALSFCWSQPSLSACRRCLGQRSLHRPCMRAPAARHSTANRYSRGAQMLRRSSCAHISRM